MRRLDPNVPQFLQVLDTATLGLSQAVFTEVALILREKGSKLGHICGAEFAFQLVQRWPVLFTSLAGAGEEESFLNRRSSLLLQSGEVVQAVAVSHLLPGHDGVFGDHVGDPAPVDPQRVRAARVVEQDHVWIEGRSHVNNRQLFPCLDHPLRLIDAMLIVVDATLEDGEETSNESLILTQSLRGA